MRYIPHTLISMHSYPCFLYEMVLNFHKISICMSPIPYTGTQCPFYFVRHVRNILELQLLGQRNQLRRIVRLKNSICLVFFLFFKYKSKMIQFSFFKQRFLGRRSWPPGREPPLDFAVHCCSWRFLLRREP